MVAELDGRGVELPAYLQVLDRAGGLEDSGEGEVVRGEAGRGHGDVGGEALPEAVGAGMGAECLHPCRLGDG